MAAASRSAMTILRIPSIARVAATARAGSASLSQLEQPGGDHLPAHPEAVFEPAALGFLTAVDQRVPVVVDLVLVAALDRERHCLVEREHRAAVDADEPRSVENEPRRHHLTGCSRARVGVAVDEFDRRVREDRGVERHRVLQVVVEPQRRCDGRHLRNLLSKVSTGQTVRGGETHRGPLGNVLSRFGREDACEQHEERSAHRRVPRRQGPDAGGRRVEPRCGLGGGAPDDPDAARRRAEPVLLEEHRPGARRSGLPRDRARRPRARRQRPRAERRVHRGRAVRGTCSTCSTRSAVRWC